jgi:type IV secretory pathway ATPase VirB11/archaellum biosynthesis ATPase/chloramphenicol O-acetyltransferase
VENPPKNNTSPEPVKKQENIINKLKNLFKKKEEVKIKEENLFKIEPNKEIIKLPDLNNEISFEVRYPLITPYAYAHIKWDPKQKELIYLIEEPILTKEEKTIFKQLEEGIKELINISFISLNDSEVVIEYLEKNVKVLLNEFGFKLNRESFLKIMYYIYRNFVGLNEIEPLLNDYFIEDIECNGSKVPVYIVHRKYRNLRTNLVFPDNEVLANLVEKIAQKSGSYVSYANPILDSVLPDGSIDYEEPIIYKEDGLVKISKIGEFVDKYYQNDESNKPIHIQNIEVPAFDKESLKINWKKVDYVYRHKINEHLFELQLEFGRKLRLTGCHSIFSLTNNGVGPERTDKLKIGDYIAIPLIIPENNIIKEINVVEELSKTIYVNKLVIDNVPNSIYSTKKQEIMKFLRENYKLPYQAYYEHKNKKILPLNLHNLLEEKDLRKCKIRPTSAVGIPSFIKVDKDLIKLLGLYMAEGWVHNSSNAYSIYFSLNKKETNLIETIKKSAENCFDLKAYIEPEEKNAIKVKINSYVLWILFNKILKVSKGAKNKRIPNIIFNISKELQQEFLRYWSLGDYGSTASKDLANDISYLSLFNRDIVAFYSREREALFEGVRKIKSYEHYTNFFVRETNNPYPHMIPTNIFNPLKETHPRLLRNKRVNKERLKSMINKKRYKVFTDMANNGSNKFLNDWVIKGFIKGNKLTEKGKRLVKELEVVNKLIHSDLGFAKIKSIIRVKPKKRFVYDLSVKDYENFIGGKGGICCHNSRVNATYTKDISTRGPTFSIRKFTKEPWTPIKLMDFGTVSPEILAYLWLLIEYGANLMIIGGTGSGKTSFLNSIAFFIPPKARIVTIEDTREISLIHDNWLPAVARAGVGLANIMGQKHGEVTLFDLLKESFRQRPDYVIVGEIRGKEAFVMFQGAASGHPTASTMHAESVETMIRRLETNPINLSPSLVESLDVVCVMIQTKVNNKSVRRLSEVVEVIKVSEDGRATTNTPFVRDPAKDIFYSKKDSYVFNKISRKAGISIERLLKEFDIRSKILMAMYKKKIFGFKEVQEIINEYYLDPRSVMIKLGLIK